MMPIKAVLFDLGGTLLHYDRPGVEVLFREEHDAHIRPDARLHNLSELPAVLAQWRER